MLSNGWFFIRFHFWVSIFLLRTGISGWHTEITCLDIYATVITVVALSQHKWYMIGIFSSYCKPYDKTNIRDFANSTQTQIKCLRKLRNKCYLSAIYTCREHNSSYTRDYKLFAILCLHCVFLSLWIPIKKRSRLIVTNHKIDLNLPMELPVNNWAAIVRPQRRCMLEQSPQRP